MPNGPGAPQDKDRVVDEEVQRALIGYLDLLRDDETERAIDEAEGVANLAYWMHTRVKMAIIVEEDISEDEINQLLLEAIPSDATSGTHSTGRDADSER